jgi:hypothetical protein
MSADGKMETLEIKDLKPVMQMLVKFPIKAKGGTEIEQQLMNPSTKSHPLESH